MTNRLVSLFLAFASLSPAFGQARDRLDLGGEWSLQYGETTAVVTLPGTMDTNRQGTPCTNRQETTRLTRLFSYTGPATYSRTVNIPQRWKNRNVTLYLERTKFTKVYVDGTFVDSCNRISTPHVYQLGQLKPGAHQLTIVVDNGCGIPQQLYASSHALCEDTQTNWNGIIGLMYLTTDRLYAEYQNTRPTNLDAFREFRIKGRHFYANGQPVFLRGKHDAAVWPLTGHCPMDTTSWRCYFETCAEYGINHVRFHSWCPPEAAFAVADDMGIYLQPELPFWGDFNADDRPLMDYLFQEGVSILETYGSHPSFVMFSLGNELWGSIDEMARFVEEFRGICPEIYFTFGSNYYLGYQGVKPGMDYFTTCRVGGEAWGSYDTHTRGSFSFADAKEGGLLNAEYPGTLYTLDAGCLRSEVPVISHETGQFQTFPDFDEIEKYIGVLYPYNLEVFKARLDSAGMLGQAFDFHRASGMWSMQLYKADVELDLRTESMAGFQLLDLQDYPGQGSAYVGILDAFMEPKHNDAYHWHEFCDSIVMLAAFPRYTYTNDETLKVRVQIANYGGRSLQGKKVVCGLVFDSEYGGCPSGMNICQWLDVESDSTGLLTIGDLEFPLDDVEGAQRCTLRLCLIDMDEAETLSENEWPLWVYPKEQKLTTGDILVTTTMTDEIGKKLSAGAKVLWMPYSPDGQETVAWKQLEKNTVGGLFQTDYWNYRMFKTICENNKKPVSPGTLGLLCHPEHPLFTDFPTEGYTSWQWFPIIKASRPLVLDNLPKSYLPVVQVIDNVERNHKLGLVSEFAVGRGKLLICMSHLDSTLQYPEGRQFYLSLMKYMQSDNFQPSFQIPLADLMNALTGVVGDRQLQRLDNISNY